MKQRSIAKKVTWHVLLLLLIATLILFAGSFLLVYRLIYRECNTHDQAIATAYADLVTHMSEKEDVPVDAEHPEIAVRYGEYVCQWYNIDYCFLYVPDLEHNKLTCVCVCYNEAKTDESLKDHLTGQVYDYQFSEKEREYWYSGKYFATQESDDRFGHEVRTLYHTQDARGNEFVAGVDSSYGNIYHKVFSSFFLLAAIIVAVLIGVYFAVYLIVRKRISRPAQAISESMQAFITDGKRSHKKLEIGGADEYARIADAFNSMAENIDDYLNSIDRLNRDQERRQTELDIASGIQQGFLPPRYLRADKYELRAVMDPARDVGGDLYDYVKLDEDRVMLAVADVSGKGISASLFMAIILTLFYQYAQMDLSPDEILRRTNDTLSANNPSLVFATAFVAIYDSRTRTLTYSNAGHNLPYVVSDVLHTLDGESGALLGLFEDETYPLNKVSLHKGDTLLLYTDGVTEATDSKREFYGVARLENALTRFRAAHAKDLVTFLRDDLRIFSGDTEPHDDITMLTLTVHETTELLLDLDIREMEQIKNQLLSLPLPRPRILNLCLAAEECFANICSYAFEGGAPQGEKVRVTFTVSDRVTIRFEDGGKPFNPLDQVYEPDDYDPDLQMGGLGRFIAVSVVDEMNYEYQNGKNILTMTIFEEEQA